MKIQQKLAVVLMLAVLLANTACNDDDGSDSNEETTLMPSTIVFANGTAVTKIMGNPIYINPVSGIGSGTITYISGTEATATVDANTGIVTLVSAGTTVITANKAATDTHAAETNSYTLTVLGIGSSYQGGKIAYILQPGDPGYEADFPHGLIAAVSDMSESIQWALPAYWETSTTGTGLEIGTGSANTDTIIDQNGAGVAYAAGLARAYDGGDYHDWYLPSKDELNKLYINKAAIGGFKESLYWSSSDLTQDAESFAWFQLFSNGQQYSNDKNDPMWVRAVRSF